MYRGSIRLWLEGGDCRLLSGFSYRACTPEQLLSMWFPRHWETYLWQISPLYASYERILSPKHGFEEQWDNDILYRGGGSVSSVLHWPAAVAISTWLAFRWLPSTRTTGSWRGLVGTLLQRCSSGHFALQGSRFFRATSISGARGMWRVRPVNTLKMTMNRAFASEQPPPSQRSYGARGSWGGDQVLRILLLTTRMKLLASCGTKERALQPIVRAH